MEQRLTFTQILEQIRDGLGEINVPMKHIDDIGIPIARQIAFVNGCLSSIAEQEQKAREAAEQVQEKVPEEPAIKEAKPEDVPEDAEIIDLGEIRGEDNGNDHAE